MAEDKQEEQVEESNPVEEKKQEAVKPKTNNQKLIVGLVLGIVIGVFVTFYFTELFPVLSSALINVLIALFVIVAIGTFIYTWYKEKILALIFGDDFKEPEAKGEMNKVYVAMAKEYISHLTRKLPSKEREMAIKAAPRLIKLGISAYTRSWAMRLIIAIFVAIGGLLGAILLYNQNQLLTKQNERIDIQNSLIEAERRSSLVFLMSNILDKVDEEIKAQRDTMITKPGFLEEYAKYKLSKPLTNRIIALSRAFNPYRVMQGDTLSKELQSPERGQLFIALMKNNLDSITQNTIVSSGNFSNAVIGKINLRNANLYKAALRSADLVDADLPHANLYEADLRYANLYHARLHVADLFDARLDSANLYRADLRDADLRDADLRYADLRDADLRDAKLIGANFRGANLRHADLSTFILREANLREVNFREANLLVTMGLTKERLLQVKTLYQCKNLYPQLEKELRAEKPCLFEDPDGPNACPENDN